MPSAIESLFSGHMIYIGRGEKVRPLTQDLSIFNKINLERPPVGVKFLFFRPERMEQLSIDENLSLSLDTDHNAEPAGDENTSSVANK